MSPPSLLPPRPGEAAATVTTSAWVSSVALLSANAATNASTSAPVTVAAAAASARRPASESVILLLLLLPIADATGNGGVIFCKYVLVCRLWLWLEYAHGPESSLERSPKPSFPFGTLACPGDLLIEMESNII